jgi:hypothetical protein
VVIYFQVLSEQDFLDVKEYASVVGYLKYGQNKAIGILTTGEEDEYIKLVEAVGEFEIPELWANKMEPMNLSGTLFDVAKAEKV